MNYEPGEYSGGVQVSEGGSRSRISQVVSRYIDSLDRSNRSLLGGGNSFLHATHVSGQGWLVSYGGGNTTQQGGYFGTGLKNKKVKNSKIINNLGCH